MSHVTAAPPVVQERPVLSVERLTALVAALADDRDRGRWIPGLLERILAARLLVACAGDGLFTPVRVRETLLDGSVALTYAGDGRLARLLAQLIEATTCPEPASDAALTGAWRLLERVAWQRAEEE
ncbi:hypothetical protein ABTY96_47690 [Streptomyces sp. NPDC096057]|uniref:hypothetical protein n=1 Tax=Streptomyces sp. NPDC096057 TaxID=3155543 RepID=UPI003317828D